MCAHGIEDELDRRVLLHLLETPGTLPAEERFRIQ